MSFTPFERPHAYLLEPGFTGVYQLGIIVPFETGKQYRLATPVTAPDPPSGTSRREVEIDLIEDSRGAESDLLHVGPLNFTLIPCEQEVLVRVRVQPSGGNSLQETGFVKLRYHLAENGTYSSVGPHLYLRKLAQESFHTLSIAVFDHTEAERVTLVQTSMGNPKEVAAYLTAPGGTAPYATDDLNLVLDNLDLVRVESVAPDGTSKGGGVLREQDADPKPTPWYLEDKVLGLR